MKHEFKVHFYIMERFRDFLKFRPSGLITTLTYVLMDNFCHCFLFAVNYGKKIYNDIN